MKELEKIIKDLSENSTYSYAETVYLVKELLLSIGSVDEIYRIIGFLKIKE